MGTCYNSTVINAPVEKVWPTVRNFYSMSWAKGMNLNITPIGDFKADQVGAKRILSNTYHETLLSLDDRNHSFTYQVTASMLSKDQVKNFIGTISLHKITDENKTLVVWNARFEAIDDEMVEGLCNPFYQNALKGLKEHFS